MVPSTQHADQAPLHQIELVRERQDVALRTAVRKLKLPAGSVREQLDPASDLTLSQLYAWQQILNCPVSELLVDEDQRLSEPIKNRAALLQLMKTAVTIRSAAKSGGIKTLSEMLVEQLVELFPEFRDVMPWGGDGNVSRKVCCAAIASRKYPDDWFAQTADA